MADSKLEAMRRLAEDSPFEGERAAARAALERLAAKAPAADPANPYPFLQNVEFVEFGGLDGAGYWTFYRTIQAWPVVRGGARGRRSAVGSRAQATRPDLSRRRRP